MTLMLALPSIQDNLKYPMALRIQKMQSNTSTIKMIDTVLIPVNAQYNI